MKIAITGGHLAPALAVIKKLPQDTKIIFLGRKNALEGDTALSLEYQRISEMNIPFYEIKTGRLQRKLTRHTLSSLSKIPMGMANAYGILKKEKPDVVLTFGGYLALPVVIASSIQKIPIVIHEQTLEAGLTNIISAKFATNICISWESSRRYFPKNKVVLTGNPIQAGIESPVYNTSLLDETGNEKLIYITGGSLGSHAINKLIEGCIESLLNKYVIIHQVGDASEFADFDRLQKTRETMSEKNKKRYRLTKFVSPEDVGGIMKKSHLVIARSGVNTVTELLFLKKPALLIPLPYAQAQEQNKNAEMLKKIGLAEVESQETLTEERLLARINDMIENREKYKVSEEFSSYKTIVNAAESIVEVVKNVHKKQE